MHGGWCQTLFKNKMYRTGGGCSGGNFIKRVKIHFGKEYSLNFTDRTSAKFGEYCFLKGTIYNRVGLSYLAVYKHGYKEYLKSVKLQKTEIISF